jgi:hypothetical protein
MASETLIIGFGINHPSGGLKPDEVEVVQKKGSETGTNGNGKNENGTGQNGANGNGHNGANGQSTAGSSENGPKGKEVNRAPTVIGVSLKFELYCMYIAFLDFLVLCEHTA